MGRSLQIEFSASRVTTENTENTEVHREVSLLHSNWRNLVRRGFRISLREDILLCEPLCSLCSLWFKLRDLRPNVHRDHVIRSEWQRRFRPACRRDRFAANQQAPQVRDQKTPSRAHPVERPAVAVARPRRDHSGAPRSFSHWRTRTRSAVVRTYTGAAV